MKYDKEADEVLWTSREIPYKPQASIHAEIKQYKGGIPKVTIIEAGVGFRGRPYTGAILKRIDIKDVEIINILLMEATPPLKNAIDTWEKQKAAEELIANSEKTIGEGEKI